MNSTSEARRQSRLDLVCFPTDLTEKTLEAVPREFTCAGREPAFDFTVGPEAPPVCRSTGGAVNLLDFTSQASRALTIQDCRELAQLIDRLEHTAFAAAQTPCDVPLPVYDIHALKAMLESGRKHLWALVTSSANLAYQIEMMLAVAGSAEAIKRVALGSGEFLTDEHTGQFVRKESQYIPRVLSYQGHQAWTQNPKHLAEEAQERVADLLDKHEVPPLETGLQQELHRITAAAEKARGCR